VGTSDSPLQMPARRFEKDEKQHRANNQALEQFGNFAFFGFVPVGGVIGYAGATAPAGYVACNGAAINRRAYKELFSIIGTEYGPGDGSTTFNVPTRAQASAIFGGTNAAASDGIMLIRTGVF
jgi:hypothetical protein